MKNRFLYKYLDIKGGKMMLMNHNLQYTNAAKFNDPFDCHPSLIDFDSIPPEHNLGWDFILGDGFYFEVFLFEFAGLYQLFLLLADAGKEG